MVRRVNEKDLPLKLRTKLSVGKIKIASQLFLESDYLLIEYHLFAKEKNYVFVPGTYPQPPWYSF